MTDPHNHGTKNPLVPCHRALDLSLDRDQQSETKAENEGLCATCELRETCAKPKVPGGIWSCNDYSEL